MLTYRQEEREQAVEDVAQRGAALYETQLKVDLEREHAGKLVAIHPDSGTFVVADAEDEATRLLRIRQPQGLLLVRRIGSPTKGDLRLASRLAAHPRGK